MTLNEFLVERAASRAGKPCGCEQGGYGLLIGVAVAALYLLWQGHLFAATAHELYLSLALVFSMSIAGKFIGIFFETRALQREATKALSQNNLRPISGEVLQKFWRAQPRPCCGQR